MQSWFTFEIDGATHRVDGEPASLTLAAYFAGQDFGAGRRFEGADPWLGGAMVLMLDTDGEGRPAWRAVDASTLVLPALAGRRLMTVEGIRRAGTGHPVVEAVGQRPWLDSSDGGLANVTAGLFEGYYRRDLREPGQFSDQLDLCLSRTAHYAAIRETAGDVFGNAGLLRGEARERSRAQGMEEAFDRGEIDFFGDPFSAALTGRLPELPDLAYVDREKHRFYRPQNLVDLLNLLKQYPEASLAGGSIALVSENEFPKNVISTEGVSALRTVSDQGDHWEVGAAAPLTVVNEAMGDSCPALSKMLRRFGSRAIRNRATLGGYLAHADARGELAPVLMALDARVLLVALDGEREVPVAGFFEGEGETNLRRGEIIGSVLIPRYTGEVLAQRGCRVRICDAYKVAPRREMFPATVTGGFAVELDGSGNVTKAWLAYSGLAGQPVRARRTEAEFAGKPWSEDSVIGLLSKLSKEIVIAEKGDPGDRDYRRQLVITLLQKFYYQHTRSDGTPVELGAVGEFFE